MPTSDARSDYELLMAWRGGDNSCGNALVERYVATVYRFFANKVNDGIEDLAQRTFLACVEARDRFDESRNFRAYLLGIARNQLYRYYRRVGQDAKGEPLGERSVEAQIGSPTREIADRQERRLLLRALRQLPLDTQIALELFYWEGLSITDMADALDAPEGTIKSRLSRGKGMLRTLIPKLASDPQLSETTLSNLDDWAHSLRKLTPASNDRS
jgi:RNA polymerase sigma-70 factor (ECF subfamily)